MKTSGGAPHGSNVIAIVFLLGAIALAVIAYLPSQRLIAPMAILAGGLVLMQSPKVAQQWERGVVLRLGRFVGLRGPGIFWIVPFVDRVSSWIDQRTITTSFAAEQTLTSDTVPVNVDAVLFWMVHDAQKAALEVQDYPTALHLRAMNMLYEGLKEKGALMLISSSAVESMGMGGLMRAAALCQSTLTGDGGGGVNKEG